MLTRGTGHRACCSTADEEPILALPSRSFARAPPPRSAACCRGLTTRAPRSFPSAEARAWSRGSPGMITSSRTWAGSITSRPSTRRAASSRWARELRAPNCATRWLPAGSCSVTNRSRTTSRRWAGGSRREPADNCRLATAVSRIWLRGSRRCCPAAEWCAAARPRVEQRAPSSRTSCSVPKASSESSPR